MVAAYECASASQMRNAEVFRELGNALSFVAASMMLCVIFSDASARKQLRPRMLGVLGLLDAVAALFWAIDGYNKTYKAAEDGREAYYICRLIGNFFSFSSYSWTCCIAYHIHYVLTHNTIANSDDERRMFTRYSIFMIVTMGCVWLPCQLIFWFAHPGSCFRYDVDLVAEEEPSGCYGRHTLIFSFLVWQWVVVAFLCIRIHIVVTEQPAAAKYRQQARWFLLVFMVTTVQWLVYEFIRFITGQPPHSCYLVNFGQPLFLYTGLSNAMVWGLSGSCLRSLIIKCCNDGYMPPSLSLSQYSYNAYHEVELGSSTAAGSMLSAPLLNNNNNDNNIKGAKQRGFGRGSSRMSMPGSRLSSGMHSSTLQFGGRSQWESIRKEHLRLEKSIGTGKFGVVWKGQFQGNPVAIKEVSRKTWEDDAQRRGGMGAVELGASTLSVMAATDILSEASILAQLRHPNTVLFYGIAISCSSSSRQGGAESYLFVTELCDSSLDKEPLGVGRPHGRSSRCLWEVLVQVAAGMQYLHSKGILHRDLKPGNVLVSKVRLAQMEGGAGAGAAATGEEAGWGRGRLQHTYKVCDFGLSRMLAFEHEDAAAREKSLTGGVGTPLYMSPELILDDKEQLQNYPFACDVFSFGVLAWQVLSGLSPYRFQAEGLGAVQVLRKIVKGMRPKMPGENAPSHTSAKIDSDYSSGSDDSNTVAQNAVAVQTKAWPADVVVLLEKCWAGSAAERPVFGEVLRELLNVESKIASL